MKSAILLGLALFLNSVATSGAQAESVLISELADPRLNYQSDRFIEIYNAGSSVTDLTGWSLVAVGNGADIFSWSLSGLIQPGEALVMGDQTLTVAFSVDFPAEGWSTSNGTWNGKVGDGAKLVDASAIVVDYVVADGTRFENGDYVRNGPVTGPNNVYSPSEWTVTPIDFPTEASPGSHSAGVSRPVITAIQTAPAAPTPSDTVNVSANITDTTALLTAVELRWGTTPSLLPNIVAMTSVSGDTWTTSSSLPAQNSGTTVYYKIEAFNDVLNSTISDLRSYAVAQIVSIFDIQGQVATSPYAGTTVRTQGVVTAVYGTTYVIQNGTGAWSGLWCDGLSTPSVGDQLDLQGTVTETFGTGFDATTFLSNVQILGTSVGNLPAPLVLSTGSAFVEGHEGVLVRILDADCTDVNVGAGVWQIDDGSGPGHVDELGYDSNPTLGTRYNLTGPLANSNGMFQLEPRSTADIVWSGDTFAPQLLSVAAENLTTIRVTFTEALDQVTGQTVGNFTVTGASVVNAILVSGNPSQVLLTTSSMAAGTHTLTVNGVQDAFGNAVAGIMSLFELNLYGPPAGYYASATGLSGVSLRAGLHQIIANHSVVSYSGTLGVFVTSDDKPNGKVWDMYSDIPGGTPLYEYTFGVDSGSSASGEGQGYNREHAWPRSWFGGAVSPMNSDLFQLYPTDIYMNSIRGSFPYGEVSAPSFTSSNGSKRGPNTYPGYVGTVFEPIDAYKGDFARSYFYMTTRYYTEDGSWPSSGMTTGSDLKPWAQAMLYAWHTADPVSNKERERNQVIFGYQGNRNPFIDRPDFVAVLFGLATAVENNLPTTFQLRANAPNPFSTSTSIAFNLATSGEVSLSIYDVRGRYVRGLFAGDRNAGLHVVHWNGRDNVGKRVSTGTYFYLLRAGSFTETKSMTLVR